MRKLSLTWKNHYNPIWNWRLWWTHWSSRRENKSDWTRNILIQPKHIRQLLEQTREDVDDYDIPMFEVSQKVKSIQKKCSSNIKRRYQSLMGRLTLHLQFLETRHCFSCVLPFQANPWPLHLTLVSSSSGTWILEVYHQPCFFYPRGTKSQKAQLPEYSDFDWGGCALHQWSVFNLQPNHSLDEQTLELYYG